MLKKAILILLIITLSVIMIKYLIDRQDLNYNTEIHVGELPMCSSDMNIRIFKSIRNDMQAPLYFDIRMKDSIIKNKRMMKLNADINTSIHDFTTKCEDSVFYLYSSDATEPLMTYQFRDGRIDLFLEKK